MLGQTELLGQVLVFVCRSNRLEDSDHFLAVDTGLELGPLINNLNLNNCALLKLNFVFFCEYGHDIFMDLCFQCEHFL